MPNEAPHQTCILVGAPVDSGSRINGCLMGPDAYRTAGLAAALANLGYTVEDRGNIAPDDPGPAWGPSGVHALRETIGWTGALRDAAKGAASLGMPVFLGGDHSLSLGTISGVASHAASAGRPLFVLWLDAHSDFHTPKTSRSGNLHGTPLAYLTGRDGFDGFPPLRHPVPEENLCLVGLRSVDDAEHEFLKSTQVHVHDMRAIDEHGIAAPVRSFLDHVAQENGLLHVSLDVDFLDPDIAPAVGTTVPGGATFREAHLVMEMVHDSGCLFSMDLVELNPFLDERGRTARAMVDLAASAFGRRVFDRPTAAA